MMEKTHSSNDATVITFGDLCEAIAERALSAEIEDGYYLIRKGDLKRFIEPAPPNRFPMLLELFLQEPVRAAG